uniref:General secretion pathway protein H n=1 Tax=Cyanothece sp. (strain PCC 7425 / ATCC 29141) TaxID=395961 RepID=B8HL72_CYAP4
MIYFFWLLPSMTDGYQGPKTAIKAKQSIAKAYINRMNRAQQAYRLEFGAFTTDINALGIDRLEQTDTYVYSIVSSADPATQVTHLAIAKQPDLRSYIGEVAVTSGDTTVVILCESKQPGKVAPNIPKFVNDVLVCAADSKAIK